MDGRKKEYWFVIGLITLVGVYCFVLRNSRVVLTKDIDFSSLPYNIGDWYGKDVYIAPEILDVLNAEHTTLRKYTNSSGSELTFFVSYWSNQKYGSQPHSPMNCLPGNGWNILHKKVICFGKDKNGADFNVRSAVIENGKNKQFMVYWYRTRSGVLYDELSLKLNLIRNSLFQTPTDAALFRLTVPIIGNRQESFALMQDFWKNMELYANQILSY